MGRLVDDEILDRSQEFALRIILLVRALPRDSAGQHLGLQLLLAGTSAGIYLHKADAAVTQEDTQSYLQSALDEVRQAPYWLGLIRRAALLPRWRLGDIEDLAGQLLSRCEKLCPVHAGPGLPAQMGVHGSPSHSSGTTSQD